MSRDKAAVRERGRNIARILAGAWRAELPAAPPPAEALRAVLPQLLATGAGPLAWRRVRETPLAKDPFLTELRNAYRLSALNVRLHEAELARIVGSLRSRGLRPLLVKGWAVARCYPEPALRPYGDLDLLFSPDEWTEADRILETLVSPQQPVEAHVAGDGAYRVVPSEAWPAVLQRAERVELSGVEIEIPAAEDHFRILCAHFLAHGAWRPLWLCDLAATLERPSAGWDWDYLLRGPARMSEWLKACIWLVDELWETSPPGMPGTIRGRDYPRWLREAVLHQWGTGTGGSRREALSLPFLQRLLARGRLVEELSGHWPNPIQASFELGAPIHGTVPPLIQCAAAARRVPHLVRRSFRSRP